jgi:hypothetical protein
MSPEFIAKEYHSFAIYSFYEKSLLLNTDETLLEDIVDEQETHLNFFWEAIKTTQR